MWPSSQSLAAAVFSGESQLASHNKLWMDCRMLFTLNAADHFSW